MSNPQISPLGMSAETLEALTAIRRDIHAHPETCYEEFRTSDIVAQKLESWGIAVTRGIGGTGVVGVLKNGSSHRAIGLRADMDALHIHEENSFDHKSTINGKMHACGHDGHTTMLLGAAQSLAAERNFDGTLHFIFQPAEEGGAGAKAMMDDGLFERFPCDAVYGIHNMPSIASGVLGVCSGPIMAASDAWAVDFHGTGGHGSMAHKGTDPMIPAAHFVLGLQSIVGRNVDPLDSVSLSPGYIHGGSEGSPNIIPAHIRIGGRTRAFKPETRELLLRRIRELAENTAIAHGCTAEVKVEKGYPPTVNWDEQTQVVVRAANRALGSEQVNPKMTPLPGSEDFSYFLEKVPGCYAFLGNGLCQADEFVHAPRYDFNDHIIPAGVAFWKALVEEELPLQK